MWTAQKISKHFPSQFEALVKYYGILAVLNDIKLPKWAAEMLAYTCLYGEISSKEKKQEFAKLFSLKGATVGNTMGALIKNGTLIKEGGLTIINPQLHMEFEALLVQLKITYGA